jgi:hypothetical protein
MQTFHIYGRLYCRGDENSFEGTITDEQLLALASAVANDDNDDLIEDFYDNNSDIAGLILGALHDDEINVGKIINGEAQPICIEEFSGGIGLTLRDAKIAFVDAEEV